MSRTKLSKNQLERDLVYAVQLLHVYEAVLQQVRDLHKPVPNALSDESRCGACSTEDHYVTYPCATANVVNGEDEADV